MHNWMQVQFWFRCGEELSEFRNQQVRQYFAHGLKRIRCYIKRAFYLYEPSPHCFLALELVNLSHYQEVIRLWDRLPRPSFIKPPIYAIKTWEEDNGEDFLNVMSALCLALLTGQLNGKMLTRPHKNYIRWNHLVHCMMDMAYGSREAERMLYHKHLDWYGPLPRRRT